jgi:hypothetical protein
MFGRRRHAAEESAAQTPQLTDAHILALVHEKIAELIGEDGQWTVSRRSPDDTDTIFHTVLANSVAVSIATAITEARNRVSADESVNADNTKNSEPLHPVQTAPIVAVAAADEIADDADEPAAFSWEPAPLTVWTDLRKPVTGEIAAIAERAAQQSAA